MKIDLVFLITLIVVIAYVFIIYKVEKLTIENMGEVSGDIKDAVKQVYLADVEAIRNLSEVASKL